MHPPRRAPWWLLALATLPASSADTAGIFEVDVVFPRNATYAPSDNFPVVLAFKNAALAKNLKIELFSKVWNGTWVAPTSVGTPERWFFDLGLIVKETNVTGDGTFFRSYHIDLNYEGQHGFELWWDYVRCNDNIGPPPGSSNGDMTLAGDPIIWNSSSAPVEVWFTIQKDAPEVDLIAATSDERACLAQPIAQPGFTVSLSGQTRPYPAFTPNGSTIRQNAGICEVEPVFSTTNRTPCQVSIDAAAAASMAAARHMRLCLGRFPPADCPKQEPNEAGQPLAATAVMVASLSVALGVAGFLLG
ncbi:hypothetical protein QBC39DRAFT_364099 [Podospora conica]|nr:hypothetical protein QBC39DRAFT_364099 [Schizothecium conicum]